MTTLGTARTIDAAHEAAGQLAAMRGELYRFLARQLAERPGVQHASKAALWDAWNELAGALDGDHLRALEAYLQSADCTLDKLDTEFSDLFRVPVGRYLTPIESAYRNAESPGDDWRPESLRGPNFHQVRAFYKRVQFEPDFEPELESDHLACELAFLGFLCAAESESWLSEDVDAAQACRAETLAFARRHPLRWVPMLRERFAGASSDPYYDVALTVIEEYLHLEVAQLRATAGQT